MNHLKKKEFLIVSLMLFSMFFGAGNFIFPPMVGMQSGENFYIAITFFCISAVALPVLGVAAIAKASSLKNLASRVNPIFASIFVATIYISIGPLLAIPRAASMPYEIALAHSFNDSFYALLIYTGIYFALNYWICLNPSKMVETLGKYLTPILLLMILILFIGALNTPASIALASNNYLKSPAATSFVEGYQTMDALAALVFGISVSVALKEYGITKHQAKYTIKSGVLAGIILIIVYVLLGYLGYVFGAKFQDINNGAALLSNISDYLFGSFGRYFLGLACFLACFTTTIGLIGSAGSYFSSISKISYKTWVAIWSIAGFLIANIGLSGILKFSVPILIAVYPIAIVLIILSLINNVIDSNKTIYSLCVYTASFVGIFNALDIAQVRIDLIHNLINKLPFYDSMLGWIVPVFIAFIVGYVISLFKNKS